MGDFGSSSGQVHVVLTIYEFRAYSSIIIIFKAVLGTDIMSGSDCCADISPKMAEIAENKFRQSNITVICGDVEEMNCTEPFDCAVVYNAFPHFTNPDRLIKKLSEMVKVGGTVTVAHGMSRKMIDHHHSGAASKVSAGLMSEDELAEIFSKYLKVIIKISDDNMYQVTGIKE